MDAFVAAAGFEAALAREVAGAPIAPCLVRGDAGESDPVFALQTLPGAEEVAGASVAKLAKAAFDRIAGPIDGAGPWTLHAFVPSDDDAPLGSRAKLVGEEVLALAKEKRKRSWRSHVEPGQAPAGALVVQVALLDRERALVSSSRPRPRPFGGDPDPRWPAGRRDVPDDKTAPSSAHRKAREAYLWLGSAPRAGESCADLGAAPGGWSWTALALGARVTAVDSADLLPPVAGHEKLEHLRRDAFSFEPDEPFDWLLCDVIAVPEKTIALLDRWLAARWCRRFVVTLKFKGDDREPALAKLRDVLAKAGARARVKHLHWSKNEATAMGEV